MHHSYLSMVITMMIVLSIFTNVGVYSSYGANDNISVSGQVYWDKNTNSKFDEGDIGLPNLLVTLDKYNILTSQNGTYSFKGLPGSSDLCIHSSLPEGFFETQNQENCLSPTVSQLKIKDLTDINFGYAKTSANGGTITGIAYEDTNGNGKRDLGERGIPRVNITISDNDGNKSTSITALDGSYNITGLAPGLIRVEAQIPNGYFVTNTEIDKISTPNDNNMRTASLFVENVTADKVSKAIDFGFAKFANSSTSISGVTYLDENGNGKRDLGETGIPDLNITVSDQFGKHYYKTTENGSYTAQEVVPGAVHVKVDPPEGYILTESVANRSSFDIHQIYYFFSNLSGYRKYQDINFGLSKSAILKINLVDKENKKISGPFVEFIDSDSNQYIDGFIAEDDKPIILPWLPNHKVKATLYLQNSQFLKPTADPVFTLENSENIGVITLDRILKGTLSGKVSDSSGRPLPSFPITASQNIDNRDWFFSTITDNYGRYNMSLLEGVAKINGANYEYIIRDNSSVAIYGGKNTLVNYSPSFLPIYKVHAEINTKYTGSNNWLKIQVPDRRTATEYGLDVVDSRGNPPINNSYPFLIRGLPGEAIRVCVGGELTAFLLNLSHLDSQCQFMKLTDDRNLTAVFFLGKHGRILGNIVDDNARPIHSWTGKVYYLNGSSFRTFTDFISNDSDVMDFTVPHAGLYQLEIQGLSDNTIKTGMITAYVSDESNKNVGYIKLRNHTDFILGNGNSLSVIPAESSPGAVITIRAQYNNTGSEDIHNATLLLEIPSNAVLVDGSTTIDGKLTPYKVAGPHAELVLGDLKKGRSGVATYRIRLDGTFNSTSLDASALVHYYKTSTKEKQQEEQIGSAHVSVPGISIVAPAVVSTPNITISGQAPVNAKVEVYDGNLLIGHTRSLRAGFWMLPVTLTDASKGNKSLHKLHAIVKSNSTNLISGETKVLFDQSTPSLYNMCMQQTHGNRVCFNPQEGIARFIYTSVSNNPYTFELFFNKPNNVSDVSVTFTGPGGGTADAILGTDGVYRAVIVPRSHQSLDSIFVAYDILSDHFKSPYINQTILNNILSGNVTAIREFISLVNGPSKPDNSYEPISANHKFSEFVSVRASVNLDSAPLTPVLLGNYFDAHSMSGSVISIDELEDRNKRANDLFNKLMEADNRRKQEEARDLENLMKELQRLSTEDKITKEEYSKNSEVWDTLVSFTPFFAPTIEGINQHKELNELLQCVEDNLHSPRPIDGQAAKNLIDQINDEKFRVWQIALYSTLIDIAAGHAVPGHHVEVDALKELGQHAEGNAVKEFFVHALGPRNIAGGVLTSKVFEKLLVALSLDAGRHIEELKIKIQRAVPCDPEKHKHKPDQSELPGIIEGPPTHSRDDPESGSVNREVAKPKIKIDPSGYVFEAVKNNRVEGVNVTILQNQNNSGVWSAWDAREFGETNPQITSSEGMYGWDVPAGDWQVIYDKPGFNRTRSEVIQVPPPRTDVNVGLISNEPPKVSGVSAVVNNSNSIIPAEKLSGKTPHSPLILVQFSKYMRTDNLTANTISVSEQPEGKRSMNGEIIPINATADANGTILTRLIGFIPSKALIDGSTYTVHVSKLVQSYAGVPMAEDYNAEVVALPKLAYNLTFEGDNSHGNKSDNSHKYVTNLGNSITAIASTNDPMSTNTTFTWIDPNEEQISSEIASTLKGSARSSRFFPTETGVWKVIANFTNINTVFMTKSIRFNVTEGINENATQLANAIETIKLPIKVPLKSKIKINRYPVTVDGSYFTDKDKTVPITLKATDADGDKLSFSLVSLPQNGKLKEFDSTKGKLVYEPNNGFTGKDIFLFRANDGSVDSKNYGKITIDVKADELPSVSHEAG